MVPALVAAFAGEVLRVVSAAKGKLFSGPGLDHWSLYWREHAMNVSVYLQHSHHHHALGSRTAASAW